MWPYWTLFLPFALLASVPLDGGVRHQRSAVSYGLLDSIYRHGPDSNLLWSAAFILLAAMIGLRYQVGGDWDNYIMTLERTPASLVDALNYTDPAYGLLNWAALGAGQDVYFINLVCAVLFCWGLVTFCRAQQNPWLAMAVAIPYLVIVVAMGYTRQGVAIGLAMLGLVALDKGFVLRFVMFMALAATFHKSAVILMPLAALSIKRRRLFVFPVVGAVTVLLFVYLLQDSVEDLRLNYIEAEYQSAGATIRIAMNALPAFLFLILRKRFRLPPMQLEVWTWMALGGLALLGLLLASPSSTAVDRVALYWIPLQLFVWSRLPNALGKADDANWLLTVAVVAYSAAVEFVWLNYADFAYLWLPYQFYPFVS